MSTQLPDINMQQFDDLTQSEIIVWLATDSVWTREWFDACLYPYLLSLGILNEDRVVTASVSTEGKAGLTVEARLEQPFVLEAISKFTIVDKGHDLDSPTGAVYYVAGYDRLNDTQKHFIHTKLVSLLDAGNVSAACSPELNSYTETDDYRNMLDILIERNPTRYLREAFADKRINTLCVLPTGTISIWGNYLKGICIDKEGEPLVEIRIPLAIALRTFSVTPRDRWAGLCKHLVDTRFLEDTHFHQDEDGEIDKVTMKISGYPRPLFFESYFLVGQALRRVLEPVFTRTEDEQVLDILEMTRERK